MCTLALKNRSVSNMLFDSLSPIVKYGNCLWEVSKPQQTFDNCTQNPRYECKCHENRAQFIDMYLKYINTVYFVFKYKIQNTFWISFKHKIQNTSHVFQIRIWNTLQLCWQCTDDDDDDQWNSDATSVVPPCSTTDGRSPDVLHHCHQMVGGTSSERGKPLSTCTPAAVVTLVVQ